MSGIYPQGASGSPMPSYRSSNQTVIVHHWDLKWNRAEILRDAYPDTGEPVVVPDAAFRSRYEVDDTGLGTHLNQITNGSR